MPCLIHLYEQDEQQRSRKTVEGGYKSTDDNYTYIRGRGRGKYICDACGIRCKKPSMLKKHIRTHTNVRPYTCKHCNFSFKTKGNLTKHMKSKAHSKKCVELGIVPVPTSADDSSSDDPKSSGDMMMIVAGDSDTDDGDDGDDLDDEEDDEDDRLDDFGSEERTSDRNSEPGGYGDESHAAMLGLAPYGPRFSTCPIVSSGTGTAISKLSMRYSEPGGYGGDESHAAMLGLAPYGPRFSTCTIVSSGIGTGTAIG
jgi:Zinc finger, C2H2 type